MEPGQKSSAKRKRHEHHKIIPCVTVVKWNVVRLKQRGESLHGVNMLKQGEHPAQYFEDITFILHNFEERCLNSEPVEDVVCSLM